MVINGYIIAKMAVSSSKQNAVCDVKGNKPVKRRQWRDKVRKRARKLAARVVAERINQPVVPNNGEGKKKKKRKRRKNAIDLHSNTGNTVEGSPVKEGIKKLEAGRFRFLNEQLYTMKGSDALLFFQNDPSAFQCYHKGFAQQVKKWPNHPLSAIIKWLGTMPNNAVVLDLGCGEGKIAAIVGHRLQVHSFDLIAINSRIIACDMANLPMEDMSADIVIFCLSLMGTNLIDYIREAGRVLKLGGLLKIAEVTSRFINIKLFCEAICKMGFQQNEKKKLTDYFMMFEFRKIGKVESKRPFGLKLKPCLYKKR